MKKAILYLLLLTYSTNLLKPVLPYVADTFSHIFWYSKHMATVHYENGNYHVHMEALNAAKKTDSPNSSNPGKTETTFSEHIITRIEYIFHPVDIVPSYFTLVSPNLSDRFSVGDYPPPRA
jgi:hypothetical protein